MMMSSATSASATGYASQALRQQLAKHIAQTFSLGASGASSATAESYMRHYSQQATAPLAAQALNVLA